TRPCRGRPRDGYTSGGGVGKGTMMTQPAAAELQAPLAGRFQAQHRSGELLVLPNAWDAGSAVLFERAGFTAVGTTSAGLAYSLGYPDGQHVSLDDLLAVQEAMVRR